jgi:catechol 2,3-dioxygenase-like lactoylglutathione lyase family enzyme
MMCQVASVEAAAVFYRDILGLTPGYVSPHWGDFTLADGSRIGLHPPFGAEKKPDGSGWILGIEVESVAALREKLESAGHHVGGYHDVPGGVVIDFADIDGNPIQAIQTGITVSQL